MIAALAVSVMTGTAALAQDATGAPRSILPVVTQETTTPPPASDGVVASQLGDGPQALGPLNADNGGFGPDLWRGAPSPLVTALMSRLPTADGSPAVHDLARRLLLTAASVDPDSPAGGALSAADRRLAAVRLEKLAARGDLEGSAALAAAVGTEMRDAAAAQLKADVFLLADDVERACDVATQEIESTPSPDWLKVLAFCRSLMGDRAGAALTMDLLQETAVEMPVFYQLLDFLLTPEPRPALELTTLQPASPLLLAMALSTALPLPADAAENASPLMLAKLATVPSLAAPQRLEAAWAVARLGGLEPVRLRQLYAALPFSDQERRAAAVVAPSLGEAAAMALFTQAIAQAEDGAAQARLVQAAVQYAKSIRELPLLAALTADLLTPVDTTGPVEAAPDLARLLLLAGKADAARAWYDALRISADGSDPAAVTALIDLWPLLLVGAGGGVPLSPEVADLWWQHQQPLPADVRSAKAALLLALLEALGTPAPESAWTWLDGGVAGLGMIPGGDVWEGLTEAAAQGRLGETALSALVAMGEGGPARHAPMALAAVVRSLLAVGLEADARRLAVEAMTAQGF